MGMRYMDWQDFPAIAPLVQSIIDDRHAIFQEAVAALDLFSPSPEVCIQNPNDIRLFILPLRWKGLMVNRIQTRWKASGAELIAASPTLSRLIDHPAVQNTLLSMSMPGCEIYPHEDNVASIGDVYRLHVGLNCPAGDCALIVGGERREWRDGEAFLFDSARVIHSAHNRTERPRMIIIMDIDRKALV